MPIEYAIAAPWLDDWPIRVQVWQPGAKAPGKELDLTQAAHIAETTEPHHITGEPVPVTVTMPRDLVVQLRAADGKVDLAYSESLVNLQEAKRGVLSIAIQEDSWKKLRPNTQYTLEAIAYGLLYHEQPLSLALPKPGLKLLNGVEVYGSPRQVLELLGPVPGASVEVLRDLSGGWALDERGYWKKTAPTHPLYGLWVNDRHAQQVNYAELATAGDRAWARTSDYLYYKGPEDLSSEYVETAYSVYVWRCLKKATCEVNRRTGRFFNLQQIYRETHRGLNRHRQLIARHQPIHLDDTFRLDALSYTRSLYRRYTEADFDSTENGWLGGGQVLHCDTETGIITINQNVWDWWDWGNNQSADYGLGQFAYLPRGENNIELTYVAGYETTPADIDEACCNLAAIRQGIYWNQAITQGLKGINVGCVNMNFDSLFSQWFPSWQSGADRILESYQHIEVEGI